MPRYWALFKNEWKQNKKKSELHKVTYSPKILRSQHGGRMGKGPGILFPMGRRNSCRQALDWLIVEVEKRRSRATARPERVYGY
jgi:hypothetical protein